MTEAIYKIFTIAKYTFKELVKSKVLLNVIFLGLGLLLVTFVAYSFTYGEPSKIALDFGLGTLSLSSVAIAIFIGVGILYKEIESRTVYMIISRPVPRFSFIIGKILGLIGILVINILILATITLSLYFSIGGEFQSLILWAVGFIILESVLVLLVVSVLSLISTQTISVILTVISYICGHAISGIKLTSTYKLNSSFQVLIDLYHFILPGFYKLNLKDFVLYEQKVEYSYLFASMTYGLLYSGFLIMLAIIIFDKKNLD